MVLWGHLGLNCWQNSNVRARIPPPFQVPCFVVSYPLLMYAGLISPSIMLPPRRLDTLLSHARSFQRSSCTHHAGSQADKAFSLYVNHSCSRTQFPTLTTHILAEHLDEVWRLEWSHDGRFLASASQDKTAIIWKISVSFPSVRVILPLNRS
jgi:hypothetical protein